jgi:glycosyltransferase involved in cell wall biosynthesis
LRVLFQARPALFTQPGGDTVVVQRLMRSLTARGIAVRFSGEPEIPAGTDVVHAINFATPEVTQTFAEQAQRRGVPLVVTTLYEDWPRFFHLAKAAAAHFAAVLDEETGVPRHVSTTLAETLAEARVKRAAPARNAVTSTIADVLLACGESERRRLLQDYPRARSVRVVPFGADHLRVEADATTDHFARTYGVRDFVLCVGRLEPRKNQLMLLEALRDDPRPVVLVGGRSSYSPAYGRLCRRFRRRGPTLVLERLSSVMLAAAFREAAVHCLPSWYELPGLVTLEAARSGARVAASSWGTIDDYLGGTIACFEPDDPSSIAAAIADALTRLPDAACERARAFTWEKTVAASLEVYESVVPTSAARR